MHPHLRPLDTGEILDGAFRLYRRNPGACVAAGLLPLSPLLLFWTWVVWRTWSGVPLGDERAGPLTMMLMFAGWLPALLTRGTRTLPFNDLRVRTEALDVRLLAERLSPAGA